MGTTFRYTQRGPVPTGAALKALQAQLDRLRDDAERAAAPHSAERTFAESQRSMREKAANRLSGVHRGPSEKLRQLQELGWADASGRLTDSGRAAGVSEEQIALVGGLTSAPGEPAKPRQAYQPTALERAFEHAGPDVSAEVINRLAESPGWKPPANDAKAVYVHTELMRSLAERASASGIASEDFAGLATYLGQHRATGAAIVEFATTRQFDAIDRVLSGYHAELAVQAAEKAAAPVEPTTATTATTIEGAN